MDAVIYHPVELAKVLPSILNRPQAATTLVIICTGRPEFLGQLKWSCQACDTLSNDQGGDDTVEPSHQQLLRGTLRTLATSRAVRLAFCPSLLALQAYLAALPYQAEHRSPQKQTDRGLVLIDPIALHRSTFGFSAQTLSRTFAMAIEAALDLDAKLEVIETKDRPQQNPTAPDNGEDIEMVDLDEQALERSQLHGHQSEPSESNIWDIVVPVLSSSNRTYGGVADTDWLTRTVKLREVAARYFNFKDLA